MIGPIIALAAAGTAVGLSTVSRQHNDQRRLLIKRLVRECEAQGNVNEQLSLDLVVDCADEGTYGLGLLAMCIGVANMGVQGLAGKVTDPAREHRGAWVGSPAGGGKHFNSYESGGLGIGHFISVNLERIYQEWGAPANIPEEVLASGYAGVNASTYQNKWRAWAWALTQREEFRIWSAEFWIEHYWVPVLVGNRTGQQKIVNARIRNSLGNLAGEVRGRSWEDQAAAYVEAKGGEDTPEGSRTLRQLDYCQRAFLFIPGRRTLERTLAQAEYVR